MEALPEGKLQPVFKVAAIRISTQSRLVLKMVAVPHGHAISIATFFASFPQMNPMEKQVGKLASYYPKLPSLQLLFFCLRSLWVTGWAWALLICPIAVFIHMPCHICALQQQHTAKCFVVLMPCSSIHMHALLFVSRVQPPSCWHLCHIWHPPMHVTVLVLHGNTNLHSLSHNNNLYSKYIARQLSTTPWIW